MCHPVPTNCWEQMAECHVCRTYKHSKYGEVLRPASGSRGDHASSIRNVLRNSFRIKEEQEKGNANSSRAGRERERENVCMDSKKGDNMHVCACRFAQNDFYASRKVLWMILSETLSLLTEGHWCLLVFM